MAVSNTGTDFSGVHSISGTRYLVANGTIPSGTTLTVAIVVWTNHGETLNAVAWDPTGLNEPMTLIDEIDLVGGSADCAVSMYGIVNPTAQTADMRADFGASPINPCAILYCRSFTGTATSSVAAATNAVNSATNTTDTDTTSVASGGSSGNLLLFGGGISGDDGNPASNAEGWTEVSDSIDSGGGAGNNQDASLYVAEKAAPSGITVTWAVSDQNAGIIIELVAGGITQQAMYHYRNH